MTGTEIITEVFEDLGILEEGGSISTNQSAKGFRRLGQIVGAWSAEGIEVPIVTWESFSLVVSQASYTIGEVKAILSESSIKDARIFIDFRVLCLGIEWKKPG